MVDRATQDEAHRQKLAALLASGLATEVWPRAEDNRAVEAILDRLRALAPEDDAGRLAIAGFTDHVITVEDLPQPCETCMYYLVNRRFCELPELMLPVEPQWSCRLWRI